MKIDWVALHDNGVLTLYGLSILLLVFAVAGALSWLN
jgi:hypothetical protein